MATWSGVTGERSTDSNEEFVWGDLAVCSCVIELTYMIARMNKCEVCRHARSSASRRCKALSYHQGYYEGSVFGVPLAKLHRIMRGGEPK